MVCPFCNHNYDTVFDLPRRPLFSWYTVRRTGVTSVVAIAAIVAGSYWSSHDHHLGVAVSTVPNLIGQIQISGVRIVPYTTPSGRRMRAVTAVLHNSGPKLIAQVWGKVEVFTESGQPTRDGYEHAEIFQQPLSGDGQHLLAPNETVTLDCAVLIVSDDDDTGPRAATAAITLQEAQ